jgi:hypothetical protein
MLLDNLNMSFKRKDGFHVKGMCSYVCSCDGLILGCRGNAPPAGVSGAAAGP